MEHQPSPLTPICNWDGRPLALYLLAFVTAAADRADTRSLTFTGYPLPRYPLYCKVDDPERRHSIWQCDPFAVLMDSLKNWSRKSTGAAFRYMPTNPLQERWNLASQPGAYRWSLAGFYESGKDQFKFLTHYLTRF